MDEWDGQEHRRTSPHTLAETVAVLDRLLDQKLEGRFAEMERIIRSGFPADDMAGHRAYHEAVIRRIEERAEFWRKLRLELAKWGLLGFLGWLIVAAWQHLLHGPK